MASCHTHATLCQSSHRFHRIHRNDWRKYSPTDFTDAHRSFWRKIFSHRIHRIHRSFCRRRASHGFHRCPQMVRLRKVLWLLWEDSLVSAWVWQGCHTLLICEHLCNLWENILHHKLLWFLWLLWENSLVGSPNL